MHCATRHPEPQRQRKLFFEPSTALHNRMHQLQDASKILAEVAVIRAPEIYCRQWRPSIALPSNHNGVNVCLDLYIPSLYQRQIRGPFPLLGYPLPDPPIAWRITFQYSGRAPSISWVSFLSNKVPRPPPVLRRVYHFYTLSIWFYFWMPDGLSPWLFENVVPSYGKKRSPCIFGKTFPRMKKKCNPYFFYVTRVWKK